MPSNQSKVTRHLHRISFFLYLKQKLT